MHINKILKFYLVLVLSITSVSALSYNEVAKGQFVSVLNALEEVRSETSELSGTASSGATLAVADLAVEGPGNTMNYIDIAMTNNPEKAFISPGAVDAEIMNLVIKAHEKDVRVEQLTLVAAGAVVPTTISLLNAGTVIGQGSIEGIEGDVSNLAGGQKIVFKDLNQKIPAGGQLTMTVRVSLDNKARTGDRLRFEIKEKGDIVIEVEEKRTTYLGTYPVSGPYVTIAVSKAAVKSWGDLE